MKKADTGWCHPTDNADQWDGFNESGMQHFAGNPIRNLAREVIQNALDAGNPDHSVIVKIKLHNVDTATVPDLGELKQNVAACYEAAENEGTKAEIFFKQAKKELDKKTIQVLEISDFNTTGMIGPCVNGKPYFAFMKAKGQSKKESATAGGSYGIGKFAPYTVSKLRTIFVSTVYKNNEGDHVQLTQAKSILMSHDMGSQRKQGTGFWGVVDKCQPVIGIPDSLPEWIVRAKNEKELETLGSKLSILCFDGGENWREILLTSIAENFFAAIEKGRLKVEIDDVYDLDKSNINDVYTDERISELAPLIKDQEDEGEQFFNSKHYLMAYQHEKYNNVFKEESQTAHLGLCELRIIVSDNLPKKVCILRNEMFITDDLKGLKQFSDFKEFAAVFICHDKQGNKLLRAMEPPKHDDFEVDLLPTREEKIKGNKALKEIAEFVRGALKRHAKDPVSEVSEIDELRDFFAEQGDSQSGNPLEEINPFGKVVIRAKPLKLKTNTVRGTLGASPESASDQLETESGEQTTEGGGGGGDNGMGGGDGEGGGTGAGVGTGTGGSGGGSNMVKMNGQAGKGTSTAEIINVRAPINGERVRRVSFTPLQTGKIGIVLKEAGADADYDIAIIKSDQGVLNNNGIELDVVSNVRVSVDVELKEKFTGALKVLAYEVR